MPGSTALPTDNVIVSWGGIPNECGVPVTVSFRVWAFLPSAQLSINWSLLSSISDSIWASLAGEGVWALGFESIAPKGSNWLWEVRLYRQNIFPLTINWCFSYQNFPRVPLNVISPLPIGVLDLSTIFALEVWQRLSTVNSYSELLSW